MSFLYRYSYKDGVGLDLKVFSYILTGKKHFWSAINIWVVIASNVCPYIYEQGRTYKRMTNSIYFLWQNPDDQPEFPVVTRKYFIHFLFPQVHYLSMTNIISRTILSQIYWFAGLTVCVLRNRKTSCYLGSCWSRDGGWGPRKRAFETRIFDHWRIFWFKTCNCAIARA